MLNKEKLLKVYEENKVDIMKALKDVEYNSFFSPVFSGWSSHLYISENDYSIMGPVSQGTTSMDYYNGLEELVLLIPADRELEDLSECSINDFMAYVEENAIDYDFEKVKKDYIENEIYSKKHEDVTDEEIEEYEEENCYEINEYLMEDFTTKYDEAETQILEEAFEMHWDEMESVYDDRIRDAITIMSTPEDYE